MMRISNKKRFKTSIIISAILLIVLVCCMLGISAAAKEHLKRQNPPMNESPVNSGLNIEEPKEDAEPASDQGKETPKAGQEGEGDKTNEKPAATETKESSKPVVKPEELPQDQLYAVYNDTLIIGDSRVEGFKLYSGVRNASYFCMKAMTIDKIEEGKTVSVNGKSLSVYDMLDAAAYDKIIVGVGLNELGWNHIETFLEDYGQLIDRIKEKQPNATIYLQAVLPVSKSKNDSDKIHNNAQVYWYNENIIKLASDKGVQFVNPAAALVDADGYLVAEATTDGVHLNAQYCKIWAEYLAELIK
ncbi:hypothetical protein EQM06_10040 [Aminipila luticellarii]|uniref:SGNH hydrolase-type esterase domain-containing protein n=2 Tax=Aminipila luticellarii TaxID=2507160 RepID=A0A410PXD9_9FIRM|nr:hypothetical protein EQM06_10040 [Aminipila luticellarii]